MKRIRGLHDINTHGTLAREGRLISVARDMRRAGRKESLEEGAWDGNVEHYLYRKPRGERKSALRPAPGLLAEILEEQTRTIERDIVEIKRFVEEGIPGARVELRRLEERLSKLRGFYSRSR